jgi:hypothetical protein
MINMSETIYFYNTFKYDHELEGIVWVDTKFNANNLSHVEKEQFPHAKIFTTSKWNAELLQKSGNHVDGIIPRFVDVETARKYWNEPKKYYFIVIASTDKEVDHKHVHLSHELLKKLGVRERSILVANTSESDYPVFSLTEDQKFKLLAQSHFYLALSGSEGFGLPPVEAMAVGTIPVYLNAHAFSEWLHGIPIRASEKREVVTSKLYMDLYTPDINDALEKMKYALSIKNDKEYKEMSNEIKKYATTTFHPSNIPFLSKFY